jgi:ferredoxin-NADP reductase
MQLFNPDIHCVTKWSKFDTRWRGVSLDTLLEHVQLKPEAQFAMAGYRRRLDAAMLAEAVAHLPGPPQCYVCGPTGLVESATTLLQAQGLPDAAIRTERFGPTGS